MLFASSDYEACAHECADCARKACDPKLAKEFQELAALWTTAALRARGPCKVIAMHARGNAVSPIPS